MRKIFFLPILCLTLFANAQVVDDFSDSDFTNNPTWTGDTAEFQISTYSSSTWSMRPRLQLNGSVADISSMSIGTPLASLDNIEWDFWVRLAFNTSTTNNARVYLVSDNQNLEGSLNGYFVMFGDDTDNALDSISLWKQSGLSTQKLISGHIAFTGGSRNYRMKVNRDVTGLWSLAVDTLGQNNPILEGTATDLSFTSSSYFGVYCRYTLTNKTNFYFDDIYVGPEIVDTIPPTLISLDVISQTELDVSFSEIVELSTAENVVNYIATSLGNPSTATRDAVDGSLVHLVFTTAFAPGSVYTLTVQDISDLSTNVMDPESLDFSFYTPQTYDIVFNEIMADPDPSVGLPSYEYLELYNTTTVPISLKNWILNVGSSSYVFADVNIAAGSYLILCTDEAAAILSSFGQCAIFSGLSLTNTGTSLKLSSSGGTMIHQISYTDNWYHNPAKDDGGWSIEQIDPNNPCGGEFNWTASANMLGGTPGSLNSVMASNPDVEAPYIESVIAVDTARILLVLNEYVSNAGLTDLSAYTVEPGNLQPILAYPGSNERTIILDFAQAFSTNQIYTLYFSDTLSDCVGNTTIGDTMDFSLYQARQFDLVINEIMVDPEPVVGLPPYEYVEIFNKSGFPMSLSNWKFITGTTVRSIPDVSIENNAYLILCPSGTAGFFESMGKAVEVSGLSITNTGTTLVLLDSMFHVISSVVFSDSWYNSSIKDEGGWSLEQIDPENPCGGKSNWSASNDVSGGTPGRSNSILASLPDHSLPQLTHASVSRFETQKVRLFFDESLDSNSVKNPNRYLIDQGVGNPISVKTIPYDYKSVILTLAANLQNGLIYTLSIKDTITDCVGNILPLESTVRFAIPQVADSGDLVVNEVLSNPLTNGVDYVEIYNRSERIFDLGELSLGTYDTTTHAVASVYSITTQGYLIFPGDYVALTTDPDVVKLQYRTLNPNNFIEMSSFPSLNNDDGTVCICNGFLELIDLLIYDADMQYPLLNSTDGVSLERINYNRPASDRSNWHSASVNVGYGTPAYLNSQYSETISDDGAITLSPEIFSPDNDGYQDVLNISYTFDQPGYLANIVIFDGQGRLIRKLIRNELLGTEGVFSWDGITEDKEKANIGIYVVWFEVFDLEGNVKRYKKAAVLAGRNK